MYLVVSSWRRWLINQSSRVQWNVCFRLAGAERRASSNAAKRHHSEFVATAPEEANSSIFRDNENESGRARVLTVHPIFSDGNWSTHSSSHLSVPAVNTSHLVPLHESPCMSPLGAHGDRTGTISPSSSQQLCSLLPEFLETKESQPDGIPLTSF